MTLYRKYRPQTIEELDLTTVRKQMAKLSGAPEKMPHAFLFAGPRGAGKTSAARILAKLVNCENPRKTEWGMEPCNTCDSCRAISSGQSMDVIELDTASNRGIDDIRALRENIALSPVRARKKVYIMDEAHMLTQEAANAFLKTLEEPPEHAMFIMATTDPHKLPETVRSRLTLVSFTKATGEEVARQLSRIIAGEKLKVEDGVIELIAKKVDGSFREAVKVLEALALEKEITRALAGEYLLSGNIRAEELTGLIYKGSTKEALLQVSEFGKTGGSVKDLIDEMLDVLRTNMLDKAKDGESAAREIELIRNLLNARANMGNANTPELPLEIAIIESAENTGLPIRSPGETGTKGDPLSPRLRLARGKKKAQSNPAPIADSASSIDASLWSEILRKTRVKNTALEAVLRTAKPLGIDGNTIELAVYYQFHKERLEAEQYRRMVETVVEEVVGITPAKLRCTLAEMPEDIKPKPAVFEGLTKVPEADIIQAAKEIFGE